VRAEIWRNKAGNMEKCGLVDLMTEEYGRMKNTEE
jgi:hypothetical protein